MTFAAGIFFLAVNLEDCRFVKVVTIGNIKRFTRRLIAQKRIKTVHPKA